MKKTQTLTHSLELFLWLLLSCTDSPPYACTKGNIHPQRKHIKVKALMKASPLPLTLGKLESFSIVEPERNERHPYSTGVAPQEPRSSRIQLDLQTSLSCTVKKHSLSHQRNNEKKTVSLSKTIRKPTWK